MLAATGVPSRLLAGGVELMLPEAMLWRRRLGVRVCGEAPAA